MIYSSTRLLWREGHSWVDPCRTTNSGSVLRLTNRKKKEEAFAEINPTLTTVHRITSRPPSPSTPSPSPPPPPPPSSSSHSLPLSGLSAGEQILTGHLWANESFVFLFFTTEVSEQAMLVHLYVPHAAFVNSLVPCVRSYACNYDGPHQPSQKEPRSVSTLMGKIGNFNELHN